MGVARAPIRAPRFAKVTPNVARNVESPVNRASSGRREEKTTGLQPVRYPNRSRPTAIAPLDQALRNRGTVPICALTRARSISAVRRCCTAPGTSFRCSHALCTSSCIGASEDRSVGSGAPAIHTHILNDTSGMPFVFMRRQGCHYFYADALKK